MYPPSDPLSPPLRIVTRLAVPVAALLLASCGEPGTDTVFVRALPGNQVTTSPAAGDSATAPEEARMEIMTYRGMYFRDGDISEFQPCGTPAPLPVDGTREGRFLLAERFRWNAMWQGRPMFAVLTGAIVLDTLGDTAAASDAAPPDTVRRFFVTGVDTVRTWENECPGMRSRR